MYGDGGIGHFKAPVAMDSLDPVWGPTPPTKRENRRP
jgi:hypothetical protein